MIINKKRPSAILTESLATDEKVEDGIKEVAGVGEAEALKSMEKLEARAEETQAELDKKAEPVIEITASEHEDKVFEEKPTLSESIESEEKEEIIDEPIEKPEEELSKDEVKYAMSLLGKILSWIGEHDDEFIEDCLEDSCGLTPEEIRDLDFTEYKKEESSEDKTEEEVETEEEVKEEEPIEESKDAVYGLFALKEGEEPYQLDCGTKEKMESLVEEYKNNWNKPCNFEVRNIGTRSFEDVEVKDRKELANVIHECKQSGIKFTVKRSLNEGYRYTLTKELFESAAEDKAEGELIDELVTSGECEDRADAEEFIENGEHEVFEEKLEGCNLTESSPAQRILAKIQALQAKDESLMESKADFEKYKEEINNADKDYFEKKSFMDFTHELMAANDEKRLSDHQCYVLLSEFSAKREQMLGESLTLEEAEDLERWKNYRKEPRRDREYLFNHDLNMEKTNKFIVYGADDAANVLSQQEFELEGDTEREIRKQLKAKRDEIFGKDPKITTAYVSRIYRNIESGKEEEAELDNFMKVKEALEEEKFEDCEETKEVCPECGKEPCECEHNEEECSHEECFTKEEVKEVVEDVVEATAEVVAEEDDAEVIADKVDEAKEQAEEIVEEAAEAKAEPEVEVAEETAETEEVIEEVPAEEVVEEKLTEEVEEEKTEEVEVKEEPKVIEYEDEVEFFEPFDQHALDDITIEEPEVKDSYDAGDFDYEDMVDCIAFTTESEDNPIEENKVFNFDIYKTNDGKFVAFGNEAPFGPADDVESLKEVIRDFMKESEFDVKEDSQTFDGGEVVSEEEVEELPDESFLGLDEEEKSEEVEECMKEGYIKKVDGQTFMSLDGNDWEECSVEEFEEYKNGGYEDLSEAIEPEEVEEAPALPVEEEKCIFFVGFDDDANNLNNSFESEEEAIAYAKEHLAELPEVYKICGDNEESIWTVFDLEDKEAESFEDESDLAL